MHCIPLSYKSPCPIVDILDMPLLNVAMLYLANILQDSADLFLDRWGRWQDSMFGRLWFRVDANIV